MLENLMSSVISRGLQVLKMNQDGFINEHMLITGIYLFDGLSPFYGKLKKNRFKKPTSLLSEKREKRWIAKRRHRLRGPT
jgi:hypothetical protein